MNPLARVEKLREIRNNDNKAHSIATTTTLGRLPIGLNTLHSYMREQILEKMVCEGNVSGKSSSTL